MSAWEESKASHAAGGSRALSEICLEEKLESGSGNGGGNRTESHL